MPLEMNINNSDVTCSGDDVFISSSRAKSLSIFSLLRPWTDPAQRADTFRQVEVNAPQMMFAPPLS